MPALRTITLDTPIQIVGDNGDNITIESFGIEWINVRGDGMAQFGVSPYIAQTVFGGKTEVAFADMPDAMKALNSQVVDQFVAMLKANIEASGSPAE